MTEQRQLVGIVVDADGTVRFDDECPNHIRAQVIAHLTDRGHVHSLVPGTRHVRIHNWTKGKEI